MERIVAPYFGSYRKLLRTSEEPEPVEVVDGQVRVFHKFPQGLLDDRWLPSYFAVFTPHPHAATGKFVACDPEASARWARAAHDYASAVDAVSAELLTVRRQAAGARVWRRREWRRAKAAWEEMLLRYPETVRVASEAYEPVRREVAEAVRVAEEAEAAQQREEQRRLAELFDRRERLAEAEIWVWTVHDEVLHVFRHDVPPRDVPASAGGAAGTDTGPPMALRGLRGALREHGWTTAVWDGAALAETERELEGITFGGWWGARFDGEDFRTGRKPAATPRSNRVGGTGVSGSGGFSGGGFSVHGV